MIIITESAAKRISANITKRGSGVGIRVGVKTTGCSGLAYVLEYVDAVLPDDVSMLNNNTTVIVDKKSLPIVDGITIDYVQQGLNEGFEFINSNEKDRCGCGESFRI